MSLTTKTRYITGVITNSKYEKSDCNRLCSYFASCGAVNWWVILHDRDTKEGGEFKTRHIHFVAVLGNAPRLSTSLKAIAEHMSENPLAVSIQKASSVEASVQYLLHMHNPQKVQYARCELFTNCDDDLLTLYLTAEASGNIYHDIKVAILESRTLFEVCERLGFKTYNAYRATIKDLWKEKQDYLYSH